jgi:methyl-accepting chemotaxis protein
MKPNAPVTPPVVETASVRLRWTIARKLYCLLGLVLALFLAVVLFTLNAVRHSSRAIAQVTDASLPLQRAVMDFNEQKTSQNHKLNDLLTEGLTNTTESAQYVKFNADVLALTKKVDDAAELTKEAMQKLVQLDTAHHVKVDRVAKEFDSLAQDHEAWDGQCAALLKRMRGTRDSRLLDDISDIKRRGAELEDHGLKIQTHLSDFIQERVREVATSQRSIVVLEAALGSLALAVGALLGVVFVRRLNHPIASLTNTARAIAEGNLDQPTLEVRTTDETAVLANAFNRMAANLRTQIQETRKIIETLSAATNQISASIQEQAASSKEEAATIQEITTTMQEIRQSSGDIANRAGEVAKTAEATSSASASGLKSVEDGQRNMESIREQVEEVAEQIVALSEKNQAVGQIIASVTEIAEQSHLLAINAAIEAVSAGERGGRFSVVAGEMRGLANQAKEATVQVRNILGDVQKGINTSVMLAEEAVKRVEAAKTQAEVTRQSIGDLRGIAQDSAQAFQQIIAGTNQQHIGVEQITQGMNDIRQSAQQTAAGIAQLEQAMHNLVSLAQQLRASIERYRL